MNEKGNACVLAIARNGLHMHSTNEVHNKGDTVKAYTEDMFMKHDGNMHVRGGYMRFSDVREKKDIQLIGKMKSLDTVLKLNPVTFKWKNSRK